MLFNSWQFAIFFPIVVMGFFCVPHPARWVWLLLSSCAFYACYIPEYLLILLLTIGVDYAAGILIERTSGGLRKTILWISIGTTCAILFFFKYYNFALHSFLEFCGYTGIALPVDSSALSSFPLPIGLSFHTFQAMSYTIEVYRGHQQAERHFGIYALYVMFYPQLVAGPIERPQNLLHQFHEEHVFDYRRVIEGLKLMAWGMFKKLVVADNLAPLTAAGFSIAEVDVFYEQGAPKFAGADSLGTAVAS